MKSISWAFESENRLVILEEDLVLENSAIQYLGKSLNDFLEFENVAASCGTRLVKSNDKNERVAYSRNFSPWGWSINKKEWLNFRKYLEGRTARNYFWLAVNICRSGRIVEMIRSIRYANDNRIDSWATFFQEYLFATNKLVTIPPRNLVLNIGWDNKATHTLGDSPIWVPKYYSKISRYVVMPSIRNDLRNWNLLEKKLYGSHR
jgi:hypothetical protein